jgi:hypothetical protein
MKKIAFSIGFSLLTATGFAQSPETRDGQHPTLAVLAFQNDHPDPRTSGISLIDVLRLELEKKNKYQVLDRFDMEFLLSKNKIDAQKCLSRFCLMDVSTQLDVEKLVVANAQLIDRRISLTIKIFDRKTKQFEKAQTSVFLNIPEEIGTMVQLTANDLNGDPNDPLILAKLTKKNDFENSINNPNQICLRSDGPRMGFTSFWLEPSTQKILKENKSQGGFDAGFPLMFQFGYQLEQRYLNEGNFQALFEFIPMITGLDQGLVIPSLTVLNGIRNNSSGWEFAFGPTVSLVKKADGYQNAAGEWIILKENQTNNTAFPTETRLDSRGKVKPQTGFILAMGKTFKSGKLNIPLNLYLLPQRDGVRFGVSFGFNSKTRTNS